MTFIKWDSAFETGITSVDHEHRELVELINTLHGKLVDDAPVEVISKFLGEVFVAISAHFALEETVMRKYDYDQYIDHKNHHEKLLDDVRDIMDAFEAGKYATYNEALSQAIHDWFVDHFRTRDARLYRKLGV
ncbi:MAG: bacteriohemerythrin [Hyphomicrobiales bacterium]|nr:bacteriohemerythrin [Hyphomicrobiales bacterium]